MKDENCGIPISEFRGLKAKMYSLLSNHEEIKGGSELCKSVVKSLLTYEHYKKCLHDDRIVMCTMRSIRSDHHQIHTITPTKKLSQPF